MSLRGFCCRCDRMVGQLVYTPGAVSSHCCFVCGTPIYDEDTLVDTDDAMGLALEEATRKQRIRDAMAAAEDYGRKRGWGEEQITQFVQGTIAVTDPENSFYQEMKSLRDHPFDLTDEERAAIFGDEQFQRQRKWDLRYLRLAREVSTWSKDPSTKVGAVIVDWRNSIVSIGFNGFARGVKDARERYENRDTKYKLIVHGERNAIIFGDRDRMIEGTLYTYPFMPCSNCAGLVIQAGIVRCVAPPIPEHLRERWEEDMTLSRTQFEEAGVVLDIVEMED